MDPSDQSLTTLATAPVDQPPGPGAVSFDGPGSAPRRSWLGIAVRSTQARVRAPELVGTGGWFGSEPLALADLRGRFVLLDFWTSCCGNCLHVLDELRVFEDAFADVATVIGIHSPKFPHEAQPAAVAAAIERYDVHHPVLNDPGLRLWQQYAVRAWPTLVLVDPEGYVVAQAAGEGQVSALAALVTELVEEHRAKGTLRPGPARYVPSADNPATALRFPAKAIVLPAERTGRDSDTLLVADAGHHQLVELALDAETVLRRFGSGERGAPFAEPNGLCLLPDGAPYDIAVADTANHVVRLLRLADGEIATIDLPSALADARTITGPVPAVLSPWDVAWWPAIGKLVVAAAGVHLLLSVALDGSAEVLAGTTVEGLRDGSASDAWLAQPSGLAVDGDHVWFVDAETSALRYLTADGIVHTVAGEGLFDFGHVDGPAASARLQHPLGVTLLHDGAVAVLDTYNGAIRQYRDGAITTLASHLAEPSGAVLVNDELVVVESAAHHLVRPELRAHDVGGDALHAERAPIDIAPGAVELAVVFEPAPGRKLDDRYGPSSRVDITASPSGLIAAGSGESAALTRTLTISPDIASGVLHVTAQVASCDDGAENPACYLARQDWGIPVRIVADGAAQLSLMLLG